MSYLMKIIRRNSWQKEIGFPVINFHLTYVANVYIPAVLGVVISSLLQVYKLTCHSSVHDHLRTKYRGYTPCTFHFQHSPPPPTHTSPHTLHPHTLHPHTPSQVFYQVLNFGMIVSSALMIWKGLMVVTGSESPIVVVLR